MRADKSTLGLKAHIYQNARLCLYPNLGHPAAGKPFERDVLAFLRERLNGLLRRLIVPAAAAVNRKKTDSSVSRTSLH